MPRNDSYAGTFRNDEWDDRPIADSSMIPLQMIMFALLAQRSMYANAFVIGSELVELPTKVDPFPKERAVEIFVLDLSDQSLNERV